MRVGQIWAWHPPGEAKPIGIRVHYVINQYHFEPDGSPRVENFVIGLPVKSTNGISYLFHWVPEEWTLIEDVP